MNRFKKVKTASILGIIGNVFLLIIKAILGIITHSKAMIADAVNSAGDILSSFITFIGNQIASKPSDECHNLGHGKAEYTLYTGRCHCRRFKLEANGYLRCVCKRAG